MAYHYNGRDVEVMELPVDGNGADIQEGAFMQFGPTADQDRGIYSASPGAGSTAPEEVIGILNRLHDFSEVGDSTPEVATTATFVLQPIALLRPGQLVAIEYDDTSQIDIASATSTVLTITSLEDQWDGGWVYVAQDVSTETGIGQLGWLRASASGNATLRSALTTTLDSTSDVVLIRPIGRLLAALSSNATKLNTYAAVTNYVFEFGVVTNEITYRGKDGWEQMRPATHHNLQLSGLSPRFRNVGYVQDLAAARLD